MTSWIVDASPLIYLAKLDRLDLLRKGADMVYVPRAVLDEVRAKSDRATQAIERACQTWLSVRQVADRQAVEIVQADLDLGEAEVSALAREIGANRIVMDDLDACRFARRLGLQMVGTVSLMIGCLPRARIRERLIPC